MQKIQVFHAQLTLAPEKNTPALKGKSSCEGKGTKAKRKAMNCPVMEKGRIASLFHEIINGSMGSLLVGKQGGAYGKDRHDDAVRTMNIDAFARLCSYHFCAR